MLGLLTSNPSSQRCIFVSGTSKQISKVLCGRTKQKLWCTTNANDATTINTSQHNMPPRRCQRHFQRHSRHAEWHKNQCHWPRPAKKSATILSTISLPNAIDFQNSLTLRFSSKLVIIKRNSNVLLCCVVKYLASFSYSGQSPGFCATLHIP